MNFQDLNKVYPYKEQLDRAFSRARDNANQEKQKKIKKDRLGKSRSIESKRICVVKDTLNDLLLGVLKSFPSLDELDPFYIEMIKAFYDIGDIKKSLASLNWAVKKITEFYREYNGKILKCLHHKKINFYRKEYYGRVSSIMKQIREQLVYLEDVRRTLKEFPTIKTSLYTVAIFGFPNVGKTTLFSKLSESSPEIKNYAFTTKNLNVGYGKFMIKEKAEKIQFIDTPGTLNRFEKMNPIEMQAQLALDHVTDLVIYVFDITCASYPIEDQIKLYNRIKDYKPIIYMSKTDIANKEEIKEFTKKYTAISDVEEIKKIIINNYVPKKEEKVEGEEDTSEEDEEDGNKRKKKRRKERRGKEEVVFTNIKSEDVNIDDEEDEEDY